MLGRLFGRSLDVPGTKTLQTLVGVHNKTVAAAAWWRINGIDIHQVQDAQSAVRSELRSFLATSPPPEVADQVRSWVLQRARDPQGLLSNFPGL